MTVTHLFTLVPYLILKQTPKAKKKKNKKLYRYNRIILPNHIKSVFTNIQPTKERTKSINSLFRKKKFQ